MVGKLKFKFSSGFFLIMRKDPKALFIILATLVGYLLFGVVNTACGSVSISGIREFEGTCLTGVTTTVDLVLTVSGGTPNSLIVKEYIPPESPARLFSGHSPKSPLRDQVNFQPPCRRAGIKPPRLYHLTSSASNISFRIDHGMSAARQSRKERPLPRKR